MRIVESAMQPMPSRKAARRTPSCWPTGRREITYHAGRCGFAVAVANAVEAVKGAAHYVTQASGGRGAVREFCDFVLRARGQLADRSAV